MEKIAPTDYPVADLIARRWSPRAFAETPVEKEKLLSLLEAARWASSCYNGQPWHYLIATREEPEAYDKILGTLIEFNQGWAKGAPVLMIGLAKKTFAHNGQPNGHAQHDLGQASANMALQAVELGLQIHQMAGFSPEKVATEFAIPEDYQPMTAIAVGYPGDPATLPEQLQERETAPGERNTVESFTHWGGWE